MAAGGTTSALSYVFEEFTAVPASDNAGTPEQPNIMILGLPGVGKTCFLNDMFNTDFESLPGAKPVTQGTTTQTVEYKGKNVTVWDTAGLFDPDRNVEVWAREMRGKLGSCKFQQIIYMINATTRVTELDIMLVTALAHLLKDAAFEECVTLIFSKCDCALDAMTMEFRDEWIGILNTKGRMKQICNSEFTRDKAFPYICKEEAEDLGKKKGPKVIEGLRLLCLECPNTEAIPAAFDALIERELAICFTTRAPETRVEITRETAGTILKDAVQNVGKDAACRSCGRDPEKYTVEDLMRGNFCFPGDALVEMDGRQISMSELRAGDIILDGNGNWTKVISWLHRDPELAACYVAITHSGGVIRMSPEHLIFVGDGCKLAGDVQPGDSLSDSTGYKLDVIAVELVEAIGVFSPLTESGHLLVNGVKASCYCGCRLVGSLGVLLTNLCHRWLVSHRFLHAFHLPLRWMPTTFTSDDAKRHFMVAKPAALASWFGIYPGHCKTIQRERAMQLLSR